MQLSGGGVCSGSVSYKVIHSLAQVGTESHIGNPSGINMCAHAHTQTCTYKETPPHPQTPTDTQPHPSISVRMTGKEPRVGGDTRGLTVTQPHAVKHSPDHNQPTHRNPQTHAHSDIVHMIITIIHTHTHTRLRNMPAHNTCNNTLTHGHGCIPQPATSE